MKICIARYFLVLVFACTSHIGISATLHVWQDSPNPGPPYDSWASAAHVIQDAVDAAVDRDTVLVTNGVYETGGRAVYGTMTNRVAVDRPLTLLSVNGPEFTHIQGHQVPTNGYGEGAIRCVYLTNGTKLNGFTLSGGATRIGGRDSRLGWGGGLWCESTDAYATNCVISNCVAEYAAGGAYRGTLEGCTVISTVGTYGGGVRDSILNHCLVISNVAGSYGGGAASSTLNHCLIIGNSAITAGGASGCAMDDCLIFGNSAVHSKGGAMFGPLRNCTVVGNSAGTYAGGVMHGTHYNCIIYANDAPMHPNFDPQYTTLINSCTIPLPTAGLGNITNEPAFLDAAAGNYRLASDSPCIDAGTNLTGIVTNDLDGKPRPIDGDGDGVARYDIGAYEYGVALEIARAAATNQVTLSWIASPGQVYALDESPSLSPVMWTPSPTGSTNPVTLTITENEKYFRLRSMPHPTNNMAWIPPGTFIMGSPTNEAERYEDETLHQVTITHGFWMGQYEVTQAEYLEVIGTNPSYWRNGVGGLVSGGPVTNESLHPVENVSWYDATNYCALLTTRERATGRLPEGYVYRLPTEAEWEYACRAGTVTSHHYGDELRSGMANFVGRYEYDASIGTVNNPEGIFWGRTIEVGSYEPNSWGLYDMYGNVWEWCWDWYGTYPAGPVTDPTGRDTSSARVGRGGSWEDDGVYCRSADRGRDLPEVLFWADGFRVVLGHPYPLE